MRLRHWGPALRFAFTAVIKLGAIAGLSSVRLVMLLGQTRILYAMASDGLLPFFDRTHPTYKTPHIATMVTGAAVALLTGFMPISLAGELVSIGTLLAFVLVCLGVPILRRSSPDTPSPFGVPMPDVVGALGAASCLFAMVGLPPDTWIRLVIWLAIGLAIYYFYGRHHSALQNQPATESPKR